MDARRRNKGEKAPLICASTKEAAVAYKSALMKKVYVHESIKFIKKCKEDGGGVRRHHRRRRARDGAFADHGKIVSRCSTGGPVDDGGGRTSCLRRLSVPRVSVALVARLSFGRPVVALESLSSSHPDLFRPRRHHAALNPPSPRVLLEPREVLVVGVAEARGSGGSSPPGPPPVRVAPAVQRAVVPNDQVHPRPVSRAPRRRIAPRCATHRPGTRVHGPAARVAAQNAANSTPRP